MYDLPSSSDSSDVDIVRSSFSKINNLNLNNIHVRRFTKPTSKSDIPPIIVRFSSTDEVHRVMKNWNLLPKGVSVSGDLTRTQRDQANQLRSQVPKYNEEHPNSPKIVRFLNGNPSLITKKNPRSFRRGSQPN